MKVKISDKQYAMIEKIARTKVGLNPQWWDTNGDNVIDIDGSCGKYEECLSTNLNGLIREAMVAKYLDNVGIAYDWWIPFASGNLVERVSEFHISKHKIDVKPIIDIKSIENGEPMADGKVNIETIMQGFALDATQSYFRNKIDDIYIGVYLKDSLNGDIRGYQWRDSTKWRRYLRESNEQKINTAMCCPVNDLISMSSFKDIDDIIFNKSITSHRFIDVNKAPAIPNNYVWSGNIDEYDITFIEAWCKEWKLVWDNGIFTRNTQSYKTWRSEDESGTRIHNGIRTNLGNGNKRLKKIVKDNRRGKLSEEYEKVRRKLKDEDRKRKLNTEYEILKRKLKDDNVKIVNMRKIGYMDMDNMENIKAVDVLGITNDIVLRSKKWKELTDSIKTMSDKKAENVKRKGELESELRNLGNEIDELSIKIDCCKKESEIIEDSFRLIDQAKSNIEEKN